MLGECSTAVQQKQSSVVRTEGRMRVRACWVSAHCSPAEAVRSCKGPSGLLSK